MLRARLCRVASQINKFGAKNDVIVYSKDYDLKIFLLKSKGKHVKKFVFKIKVLQNMPEFFVVTI